MKFINSERVYTILLIGVLFILCIELIRDLGQVGDLTGYLKAGKAVIQKKNIYSDELNTWPPLFSIFSISIAYCHDLSPYFTKFIWLFGSIICLYLSLKSLIQLSSNRDSLLNTNSTTIKYNNPIFVIPLLIILRFVLDNLANLQINIYFLFLSILCIQFFLKKRYIWVGLILGLTISLKVYTIFLLLYLLYKREFKPIFWTFFFLILFNCIPFIFFGLEQSLEYYKFWLNEVIPRTYIANHNNQSIFGASLRLFTTEDPTHELYINILNLSPQISNRIAYLFIFICALLPAYLFRKRIAFRSHKRIFHEFAFIICTIPLLTPISWKAYFIFTLPAYFISYKSLYVTELDTSSKKKKFYKALFASSIILNVFSSELFVGYNFSNVLEAYSCITMGTSLLLVLLLLLYNHDSVSHVDNLQKDYKE